VGAQQRVAILKGAVRHCDILFLDAADRRADAQERKQRVQILRDLNATGLHCAHHKAAGNPGDNDTVS